MKEMRKELGFMFAEMVKQGVDYLEGMARSWAGTDSEHGDHARHQADTATAQDYLDIAVSFTAGGEWPDGFGAWMSLEDVPEIEPHDVGSWSWGLVQALSERVGVTIDYCLVGGKDMWASRSWDKEADVEYPQSRYKSERLDCAVVASICAVLDDQGLTVADFLEEREREAIRGNAGEAIRHAYEESGIYECIDICGLKFHRVGRNATHSFYLSPAAGAAVVYARDDSSNDPDDYGAFKKVQDEDLPEVYLGHW